ncbi:hypothetical protein EFS30_04170 [Levilactobacillus parabrevis]|uniref:hypothetical protein n=1 Tax=Levilactobacillus parabrevis TaxID=357278 RepID=UPI0021A32F35|nr:hypothetical protein [Levilactobacillus parabrevis]MCT4489806.1 hypothetical protein [Levilactobacillus parabrevis]
MDVVKVHTSSRFQSKAVVVTNLAELDDIKSGLFKEVQLLAENDRLSNDEIDRLYSISDELVAWSPNLEEE